jgi:uncharacterized protein (DUF952 family)
MVILAQVFADEKPTVMSIDNPIKEWVYHITALSSWQAAQRAGGYQAESLEKQGFIHFSTRNQVVRVANAVYPGVTGLVLLVVDVAKLTAPLRYEPPDTAVNTAHEDAELFPHLYGTLNLDAIERVVDFPAQDDGQFTLPPEIDR